MRNDLTKEEWAELERHHNEEIEAWSKEMHWPPPTKDMTAGQVANQIQVATDYLEHLTGILKERCAAEGHVWDCPTGTPFGVTVGAVEVFDHSPDYTPTFADLGRRGEWQGGVRETWYRRKCTRCGHVEERAGVRSPASSPFA